uniref:Uncharacterized protein n=1 Tax=Panagrolaimus superbus TaxID=310955 RepID=A0A914YG14_9BILA
MDKWTNEQNTAGGLGGFVIVCIILFCIYRLLKYCQSNRDQPHPTSNYERVTEIVVQQRRVKICKLPPIFGPNAYLFTVMDNLDRGVRHVFVRHERDFSTSKRSNQNDVIKQLRKNLTAENFIAAEEDPRGNRYIWKTKDRNGVPKELVTILSPRGKGFELITAFKR